MDTHGLKLLMQRLHLMREQATHLHSLAWPMPCTKLQPNSKPGLHQQALAVFNELVMIHATRSPAMAAVPDGRP